MPIDAVPKYEDGKTTLNSAGLNPPIVALENNLKALDSRLLGLQGSSISSFVDIGFSDDCVKGMLVAFDPVVNKYVPARAVYADSYASDGSLNVSDAAVVIGMLMSDVSSDTSGVLATRGWITDTALIEYAAPAGTPGYYYLDAAGKALYAGSKTFNLPVRCFLLTASGAIYLDPQLPESRGHSHVRHELPYGNWESASGTSISGLPVDALFVYNDATDTVAQSIRFSYLTGLSLTLGGMEAVDTAWGRTEDGHIYIKWAIEEDTTIILHTISPFLGVSPEVRAVGVVKNNKILEATKSSGTVWLDTKYPVTTDTPSGKALSGISSSGITTTTCVSTIGAGVGIKVEPLTSNGAVVPGGVRLSSTAALHTVYDLQILNYDASLVSGTPNDLNVTFPSGITSSVTGVVRVPFHGSVLGGKLALWVRGTGGTVSTLSAVVKIQPPPESGKPVYEATATAVAIGSLSTPSTNHLYLLNSDDLGSIPSNALITATVTATNPSATIVVKTIGIAFN